MAILKNYEGLGKGEKVITKEEFEKRKREKMLSENPVAVKKDGDVTSLTYKKPKVVASPKKQGERVITKAEFEAKKAGGEIEKVASSVKKSNNATVYTFKKTKKNVV